MVRWKYYCEKLSCKITTKMLAGQLLVISSFLTVLLTFFILCMVDGRLEQIATVNGQDAWHTLNGSPFVSGLMYRETQRDKQPFTFAITPTAKLDMHVFVEVQAGKTYKLSTDPGLNMWGTINHCAITLHVFLFTKCQTKSHIDNPLGFIVLCFYFYFGIR